MLYKSLECVPSEAEQEGSEYIVRVNILPIRLNLDQHTLLFLSQFFNSQNNVKKNIHVHANKKTGSSNMSSGGNNKGVKFELSGNSSSGPKVSFKNNASRQLADDHAAERVELPPKSSEGSPKGNIQNWPSATPQHRHL